MNEYILNSSLWIKKEGRAILALPPAPWGRDMIMLLTGRRLGRSLTLFLIDSIASMAGPHVGSTIDLSEGGARIETSYTLKHGMGLEITIAIRPRVISLRAEVVHILRREDKRLKTGIRFDSMAKDDRLFLAQCIFAIMEEQNRKFRS